MGDKYFLHNEPTDIVVRRGLFLPAEGEAVPEDLVQVNVHRQVFKHVGSSQDLDCGAHTKGTYDLALNILAYFLPGAEVELLEGTRCSKAAAHLYMLFALDFLVKMPMDGGTIGAQKIQAWIGTELGKHPMEDERDIGFRVSMDHRQLLGSATSIYEAAPIPPRENIELVQLREDARRLVRLTEDFLHHTGHRILPSLPVPKPGRNNLIQVMKDLDLLLLKMGKDLGVDPPHAEGRTV